MSGIDDYNDRVRKQTMGVPVTPPTTAVQVSIDMAADADRRARQAQMSGTSGPSSGSQDHGLRELLVALGLSLALAALGLLSIAYILPKDFAFVGQFAAMAGFIFAAFALFYLLKKVAGAALEALLDGAGALLRRRR